MYKNAYAHICVSVQIYEYIYIYIYMCINVCIHMYVWRLKVLEVDFLELVAVLQKRKEASVVPLLINPVSAACLRLWPSPLPVTPNHQGEDAEMWNGVGGPRAKTKPDDRKTFVEFFEPRVRSLVQQEAALTRRLMRGISCNAVSRNTAHLFGHLLTVGGGRVCIGAATTPWSHWENAGNVALEE